MQYQWCYSNNGLSYRHVAADYIAAVGEVLFPGGSAPTGAQLAAAFPDYATAAMLKLAANAAVGGVTIALSGSMTLAPTLFPTDPATQAKIGAVATTINTTGDFPGGATSYPMKDASGTWHTFTLAQYKAVAGAISAFVAGNYLIADGNPLGATELPTNSVSLTV